MAKLTISDAARVAGVARSTLHRAMHAGRLSIDTDGRIDTAELLRAGYTLQASTHQGHATTRQVATPALRDTQQTQHPTETQALLALQQERDLLRRELDAAQIREQAALAREQESRDERQAVRDREALLLRMVEQMQHRYDRLLEAPRIVQAPRPTAVPGGISRTGDPGAMRRKILALLQEHSEGLSPAQIRGHLGVEKSLAHTCVAMARDGLRQRIAPGRYGVVENLKRSISMDAPRPTCPNCERPNIHYSRGVIHHALPEEFGAYPVIKCLPCREDFFLRHPDHTWVPCLVNGRIPFTTDPQEIDESYKLTVEARETRHPATDEVIDTRYYVNPVS